MKIERDDKSALHALVSITVEKADYMSKYNTEIEKYRQQASLKGFRKGKTPKAFLVKMFGK